MANVAITNKSTISTLSLPNASVPLGGSLKMTGFSNIRIIKDMNSNAIRDVEGYPFSLLTNFEMIQSDGSKGNAKLSGNKYINSFPSSLVSFKVYSDATNITGTMDTSYPTSLRHFVLVGFNNAITGPVPNTLSSNVDTINISGKFHNFSGSNFIPSTIPSGVFNYIVTDSGNNVGTHTSALPTNLNSNSNNLNRFNVMGCKLTGDLPTSIGSAMKTFKIGGRSNDGQYHSGLTAGQAFPSFSACTGLNTLTMANLKSSTTSRITSCASTVFTNCAFTTDANVNLSFNAFSSAVTNSVLAALDAANTTTSTSGRVINLQGNRPPTGMTATKTKTQIAAGQSTGNTSLDSLITKDWTIQYFTDANQAIYNWPS